MSKSPSKPLYCDRCSNEIQDEFTYINPVLGGWIPRGTRWTGVKKTYYLCQPCVTTVGMEKAVREVEDKLREKE